jgi:hypothetical protein
MRITRCVAITSAIMIAGITTNGIAAFAATVVVSETGSDYQNKMLRLLRSPCSVLRQ